MEQSRNEGKQSREKGKIQKKKKTSRNEKRVQTVNKRIRNKEAGRESDRQATDIISTYRQTNIWLVRQTERRRGREEREREREREGGGGGGAETERQTEADKQTDRQSRQRYLNDYDDLLLSLVSRQHDKRNALVLRLFARHLPCLLGLSRRAYHPCTPCLISHVILSFTRPSVLFG